MHHPSPQDDRLPPRNPSPPSSTYGVGLASPSSGTEIIYESPEVYEEEDEPIFSQETKKRRDAEDKRLDEQLKKDLNEITSESDEYDPTGKTPTQMDALIAKYHRECQASRMEANRRRNLLEGINAACPVSHVLVSSDCRR